jgi:hypothetical protein
MKQKRRIATVPSRSLSSLADKAVITIGTYLKTGNPDPTSLREAIDACSDILGRLPPAAESAPNAEPLSPQERDIVDRGLSALQNAASGQTDVCHNDLTALQQLLVRHSMPEWKIRMNDFRQRRLKRGLRRHA